MPGQNSQGTQSNSVSANPNTLFHFEPVMPNSLTVYHRIARGVLDSVNFDSQADEILPCLGVPNEDLEGVDDLANHPAFIRYKNDLLNDMQAETMLEDLNNRPNYAYCINDVLRALADFNENYAHMRVRYPVVKEPIVDEDYRDDARERQLAQQVTREYSHQFANINLNQLFQDQQTTSLLADLTRRSAYNLADIQIALKEYVNPNLQPTNNRGLSNQL